MSRETAGIPAWRWWRRRLAAAADWLEAAPSDPPGPSRPPRARSLRLLGAAALLAVPMSAAVSDLTGLPVGASLVAALLLALVLGLAALPLQSPTGSGAPRVWIGALVFALVAFGFAVSELYNPFFAGFPAMIGADGGNHLRNQLSFVAGESRYLGMDALYATTHWLEAALGVDAFESFRAAFYLVVAATAGFMGMLGAALLSGPGRDEPRPVWRSFALVAVVGYLPARWFLLPVLHYYQADGYYSQLFGLLPVLLASLAYGFARRRLARLLALGFSVLFCRYSYLLNIADLVVTASLLVAWEAAAGGLAASRRRLLGAIAALGGAGAVYLYARIYRILPEPGGFQPSETALAALGVLVLSGLLAVAPRLLRSARLAVPAPAARILGFCGGFGVVSASVQLLWRATQQQPGSYYYYKYGFTSVVVTSTAAIVLVAHALAMPGPGRRARVGPRGRELVARVVILAMAAVGFGALSRAHAVYRPSYAERRGGAPPWRHLDPLADREAWGIIDEVLASTGLRFGGMITPRWPESSFTNGRFGILHDPVYWKGELKREPGRCVFWYKSGHPLPRAFGGSTPRVRSVVAELEAHPGRRCRRYSPRHVPGRVGVLCHVCYPDQASQEAGGAGPAPDRPQADGT